MKLALEIGPGTPEDGIARPADIWKDIGTIETLDAEPGNNPDYIFDLRLPLGDALRNRFDYVLASHVLEHIDRNTVGIAMQNLVSVCKPGGEICLIVPSLEHAAQLILKGDNSLAVQGMIYGGQRPGNNFDVHYAGYTQASLAMLAKHFNLTTILQGQVPFTITGDGGRSWQVLSNYIVAIKAVNDGLSIDRRSN